MVWDFEANLDEVQLKLGWFALSAWTENKKVEAMAHHSQENCVDVFMNSPKVQLNLKVTT